MSRFLLSVLAVVSLSGCGCGGDTSGSFSGFLAECGTSAEWLVQGPEGDGLNNIAVLPDGSSYVIGWYGSHDAVLGPSEGMPLENGSDTGWAPFVGRYAPDGNLLWSIHGTSDATSLPWNTGGMWSCPDGGCVFAIPHRGEVAFTDGLGETTPVQGDHAGYALAVVRADTHGRIVWVQRLTSAGDNVFGFGVRSLSDGTIVLAGGTLRGGTFGASWDAGQHVVDGVAGSYAYLWKLDAATGETQWVRGAETGDGALHPYWNGFLQLREDFDGGLLVSGNYAGGISFEGGPSFSAGAGAGDAVVARYSADGELTWAQPIRMDTPGRRAELAVANPADDGDVYVALRHDGDLLFPDGQQLLRQAPYDASISSTIVRLDGHTGDVAWWRHLRTASSSDDTAFSAMDTTPDGELYVVGKVPEASELLALDQTAIELAPSNEGSADAYVARFAPDGALRWFRSAGGSGYDHACNVLVAPSGCVFVTGFSSGSPTFAPGSDAEVTLESQGGWDGWRLILPPDGGSTSTP